jgi:hypothetical protein
VTRPPRDERTGDEQTRAMPTAPAPRVSTAPAEGARRWWSAIPHHLGRARTSTVVLAALFVALGLLYLYVRPETPEAGTTGGQTGVPATVVPVVPATTQPPQPATTAPTTTAPTTTPATTTTATEDEGTATPTAEEETTTPAETSTAPTTTSRPPATTGSPAPTT